MRDLKKVAEIMRELGFREESPESTARALLSNLIRSAGEFPVEPSPQKTSTGEQLEFSFDSIEFVDANETSLPDASRRHTG